MPITNRPLTAAEAAIWLGISPKALRLYEQHGLLTPDRTAVGWRIYAGEHLRRARQIVGLRQLGFSYRQVSRILAGDRSGLDAALADQQRRLERQSGALHETIADLRDLRAQLAVGAVLDLDRLGRFTAQPTEPLLSFALPWPWDGAPFALPHPAGITYITGPLGSGKTRLAEAIAANVPGAAFIGLDRHAPEGRVNIELAQRYRQRMVEDGAIESASLTTLLDLLATDGPTSLVIDMVEDGLDEATQIALAGLLRHIADPGRPLYLMTRSSALLDLELVGPGEAILFCPANHTAPIFVPAIAGAPGYESVATCLATPESRARTAGTIAARPAKVTDSRYDFPRAQR